MLLMKKGAQSIALRCPECRRAMSKLCADSKFWNCESCNRDFEESPFISKI